MNAFEKLQQAVANAGGTLNERTRSAFGSSIAKALGSMSAEHVMLVATDAACVTFYNSVLPEELRKSVALFDATREHGRPTEYAAVRAHVSNYLRGRKVKVSIAPYRIGDEIHGFTIRKTQ